MKPLMDISQTKALVDDMVSVGRVFNVYEVERALGELRAIYEDERSKQIPLLQKIRDTINEFFRLMEDEEQSENGRINRTFGITCNKSWMMPHMETVLTDMKNLLTSLQEREITKI